ncbi:MAG: protein translocase subunit SecF [Geobacteraceae bacterium]|nr:protein translocase subunit SecF [Geobacteraceae bacterium]
MEIIGKTSIDFIGKRKIAFVISGIIALIGIIGIIQIGRGAANMGIDFSGGTAVQLKFAQPVSLEQARSALARHNLKEANLQEIREGNKLLIKVGKATIAVGKVADTIEEVFKKEFPGNSFVVESSTEIGPSIGDKLRKDTLVAIAISLLGIIIYIAWRFDFKFGIGATVATLHDVLAMIAVFFVLNKEVNLLFITAVLTIAGYSLTDTVVVFDRIRENLHKDLKGALSGIFNKSINEVLSRTIVTSLTTFMAAVSLLFFGGEVIHDFAFALVTGIVVATYSSVFVASPIVVILEGRSEKINA